VAVTKPDLFRLEYAAQMKILTQSGRIERPGSLRIYRLAGFNVEHKDFP
jgi:hypothetical protein